MGKRDGRTFKKKCPVNIDGVDVAKVLFMWADLKDQYIAVIVKKLYNNPQI